MNIKKTLLVAALAAFAFAAMPAIASAEITGAHVKFPGNKTHFVIDDHGSDPVLRSGSLQVSCTSFSGTGDFETGGTTGTITIKFHGCKTFGIINCTTPGQSTGTIVTTVLPFHVEPVNQEPGVLITPNASGSFAHFTCFGVNTTVEGNGVIGTIVDPGWTDPTDEATILFSQTGGTQDHEETDTNNTVWDLKARSGTDPLETATQEGTGIITFEEEVELQDTGTPTG